MFGKTLIAVVLALLVSLPAIAREGSVALDNGKPDQEAFVTASKRALLSRNYEVWMIGENVVVGKYKSRVEVALILADDSVVIRFTDYGGLNSDTIKKYMRNLQRDLSYELAYYAVAPTVPTDAAKISALTAFMHEDKNAPVEASVAAVVTGKYKSQITSTNQWIFEKPKERRIELVFVQDGAEVTATNADYNVKISGTIEGDTIRFFTWPSDITATELKGKWKISDGGLSLVGKWVSGNGGGDWNLQKIE